MSAIFGVIEFGNVPINRDLVNKVSMKMDYWGPDGKNFVIRDNWCIGHFMLFDTIESKQENLPSLKENHCILTFEGRIDNREELISIFGLNGLIKNELITDSELVYFAYQKWGEACADKIIGDWSFAIYDSIKNDLYIARDHNGNTGVYYYFHNKLFVFCTSISGVLAVQGIDNDINYTKIAKYLTGTKDNARETFFKHIFYIPTGSYLILNNYGLNIRRYWYPENIQLLTYKQHSDYIDHFKEIFYRAIQKRIRSCREIGGTLSSGLDSSSVCTIASLFLHNQNRRLYCYTFKPNIITKLPIKNRVADESLLTADIVNDYTNIQHKIISAKDVSILDGMMIMLNAHGFPALAIANYYWLSEIFRLAKEMGVGTLLTGQGGNITISFPTDMFYERMISKNSFINILKNYLLPDTLLRYYYQLKYNYKYWQNHSCINLDYAKKIKLTRLMRENHKYDNLFTFDSKAIRLLNIRPGNSNIGAIWNELGALYGIKVYDPTFDKNIVEFCLAIPDNIFYNREEARLLIRQSMGNILPNSVIKNKFRGYQNAEVFFKMKQNITSFRNILNNLFGVQDISDIINLQLIDSIVEIIDNNEFNIQLNSKINTIILKGIAIGLFLKKND